MRHEGRGEEEEEEGRDVASPITEPPHHKKNPQQKRLDVTGVHVCSLLLHCGAARR